MWYVPQGEDSQWMNFETGEWEDIASAVDAAAGAAGAAAAPGGNEGHIRYLTLMMSSAIIGKGGSDTGELIVAYPITSVHTVETSPESVNF